MVHSTAHHSTPQPHQGEQVALEEEEDHRPAEVEGQLQAVQPQKAPAAGVPRKAHQVGRQAHEQVEDRPHHREHPPRRGEGRLAQAAVFLHGAPGEQGRQASHPQGEEQVEEQGFPVSHRRHPFQVYCWQYMPFSREKYRGEARRRLTGCGGSGIMGRGLSRKETEHDR